MMSLPIFGKPTIERAPAHPKLPGRLIRITPEALQCTVNQITFRLLESEIFNLRSFRGSFGCKAQIRHSNPFTTGQKHGPLNHMRELADIAGPVVALERL